MGGLATLVAKIAAALQVAQGATAAVVIVATATTATVLVTSPGRTSDVAGALARMSASPSLAVPASPSASPLALSDASSCATSSAGDEGRSGVASVRNATDAALRDAEKAAQERLQDVPKNGRDDKQRTNDVVKSAGARLKARLAAALDATAALTLGRVGHDENAARGAGCTTEVDIAARLSTILSDARSDFGAIVSEATPDLPAVATPKPTAGDRRPNATKSKDDTKGDGTDKPSKSDR